MKTKEPRRNRLLSIVLIYIAALFIVSLGISISRMNSKDVNPSKICNYARKFLSDDSLYAVGKTIDCSKFTQLVYRKFCIEIPRSSAQQFEAYAVDNNKKAMGDLVFFSTETKKVGHVGIYLGNNHFIHAPGQGKPVAIEKITDNDWNERYVGSGSVMDSKEDTKNKK